MTRLLTWTLAFLLAALCGVCVMQWTREATLRTSLAEVDARLKTEQENRVELEEKLAAWEREIQQLTGRLDEQGAKIGGLETANAELQAMHLAEKSRADNLARQLGQTNGTLAEGNASIAATNEAIKRQNAAIEKQNEALKTLSAERDDLVQKLNDRTREYNSLMEKYNKTIR